MDFSITISHQFHKNKFKLTLLKDVFRFFKFLNWVKCLCLNYVATILIICITRIVILFFNWGKTAFKDFFYSFLVKVRAAIFPLLWFAINFYDLSRIKKLVEKIEAWNWCFLDTAKLNIALNQSIPLLVASLYIDFRH